MKTQSNIILFCYLYLGGIVLAKLWPVDPSYTTALNTVTGVALVGMAAFFVARSTWNKTPAPTRRLSSLLPFLVLAIPALFLGYTRYTDANTVPDTRLAVVEMNGAKAAIQRTSSIPDTCRVRIQKAGPLANDVQIRLHGELNARLAIPDEAGLPAMDREGRWRFRAVQGPQQSEVITIGKDDPVGRDYVVPQPFTRLTRIEVVQGAERGRLELFRISNHTSAFVRPGRNQAPVTLLGRISADPLVYGFKTVLPVTPHYIQYRADGPFYRIEGGTVRVTLQPRITGYETFARSDAFGYDVVVKGQLSGARPQSNPGGFDARRFLQNHNIYGHMSLYEPRGGPTPITAVAPEGGELRTGNGLVEFSLSLRDGMLLTFKQTLPYPQSAFLGAVTLGLRYGLQSARYTLGRPPPGATGEEWSEDFIFDEFREAGVNHVLAVSGLHVTIITALFMGIFALLKMPRRVYVPAIILCLIIFAIITGARPSTLRAVIMNSLFLLTWAYLGQGLQSSVLFGVPVAAFLILLHNPLMIVDPSFTLSFGAILSLALLTGPFHDQLSKLRGNNFLFFVLVVGVTTLVGIFKWPLLVRPLFWVPYILVCVATWYGLRILTRREIHLVGSAGYTHIPAPAALFIAAQFGIQIGMMLPLSSYYFARWPFAGVYANLVAIPLIGLVVQLGVLAGLFGFLPGVGLFLALMINGANWLFSSVFLWLAHASAEAFPYPFISKPSLRLLVAYYVFCAAFIWHRPIWNWIRARCAALGYPGTKAAVAASVLLAVLVALPACLPSRAEQTNPGLNITVLSVGYGSSIFVETPGGKRILLDAGFVEHDRGRRNEAIRTIVPYLAHRQVRRLDAVILTSPHVDRLAGLSYVLAHCGVKRLYLPPSLEGIEVGMSYEDFAEQVTGEHYFSYDPERLGPIYHEAIRHPQWPKRSSLVKELAGRDDTLLNRWAGWVVKTSPLRKGDVLLAEETDGVTFAIEVLNPAMDSDEELPLENNSAVLRITYGDFAMLLTSDLHYTGQQRIAHAFDADELRADVMILPHHGTAMPTAAEGRLKSATERAISSGLQPLLNKVRPDTVIIEFGNPRPVLGLRNRDALHVYENTRQFLSDYLGKASVLATDSDLAVFIHSDGLGYKVDTQAERVIASTGADEGVSDIEIGF